jgi:nitrate reductase (NAD(P)H)
MGVVTQEEKHQLRRVEVDFPPTPPEIEAADPNSLDPAAVPLPPPTRQPTEILQEDHGTPDAWLPRDPRLIRLTGKHPFNVEAPLSNLYDEGFLTSPELFYVRNHGHVPQISDGDVLNWEFTVEGLVENPLSLTLKDLLEQYEQVTYPITLVCAGNRRKEQNVVRKTKGFSWGAAGVSTALFTGVVMSEVLKRARPTRKARYVCMEGADKLV